MQFRRKTEHCIVASRVEQAAGFIKHEGRDVPPSETAQREDHHVLGGKCCLPKTPMAGHYHDVMREYWLRYTTSIYFNYFPESTASSRSKVLVWKSFWNFLPNKSPSEGPFYYDNEAFWENWCQVGLVQKWDSSKESEKPATSRRVMLNVLHKDPKEIGTSKAWLETFKTQCTVNYNEQPPWQSMLREPNQKNDVRTMALSVKCKDNVSTPVREVLSLSADYLLSRS